MTGRELILYILQNGLEDRPVFENGKFIGFKTVSEVAEELSVGNATVITWCKLDMIPYVQIGANYMIPGNCESPLEKDKRKE